MKLATIAAAWLLLPLALAACSRTTVVYHTVGILRPGSTLQVRAGSADVDAYKPLSGQPADRYTIELSMQTGGETPLPPAMHGAGNGLIVTVRDAAGMLLRVPDGVGLDVSAVRGRVSVTDVTGPVVARADQGDVRVMVPGYAQASARAGNVTVYMGSTDWRGTLHFRADRGDVELWINATAHFRAHLHTANGTIFTDFPLRGSSGGSSETIDSSVGSAARGIDVEVGSGSIRLLQLKPQV